MPRHQGALLSVTERRVRGRDGTTYPLRSLEVADDALYYAFEWIGHRRVQSTESWLIAAKGWCVTRFRFHPDAKSLPYDWYIDLDHIEVSGDAWRVDDRFLDVCVFEGGRYEVLDADELADGIESGEISVAESVAALRALDELCRELTKHGCSVLALLDTFAPGLPR